MYLPKVGAVLHVVHITNWAKVKIENISKFEWQTFNISKQISRSAHRTPNFINPEFQFPQFKVLQSVFFFL